MFITSPDVPKEIDRHLFLSIIAVAELCNRYPRATELHLKNAINVDEGRVRDVMRSLRYVFCLLPFTHY